MKVPSTTWLLVSRMKLRSSRGPNCDEASDRATRVREKTTPAMVIIEPATVPSTALAPSAPPVYAHCWVWSHWSGTASSSATAPNDNAAAPAAMSDGRNQKLERSRSQYLRSCDLTTTTPRRQETSKTYCPGAGGGARPSDMVGESSLRLASPNF